MDIWVMTKISLYSSGERIVFQHMVLILWDIHKAKKKMELDSLYHTMNNNKSQI